jgi:hypothetical protein
MAERERKIEGLRQILGYFEEMAKGSELFRPEFERTREIIGALERGHVHDAVALIRQPMAEHYGGTGWMYVLRIVRELAAEEG